MNHFWKEFGNLQGFPGGSHGNKSVCSAGDLGSIPVLGRSPGKSNGYSCILSWRILQTEEPDGLQSTALQGIGNDWVTNTTTIYNAPWKKSQDKPTQHIIKQKHYFADKGPSCQSYGFSSSHVWMWELDYKESWALKNWCFWTVVLEKTLESPLDFKEIQPVHPKGNQSWIFIGRTDAEAEILILWPPDVNWLTGKHPDAGKDWGQEEKGTTEDEMVGWYHQLDGQEFEQAWGDSDGQENLTCCNPWCCKESDMTWVTELNWGPVLSLQRAAEYSRCP